MAAKKPIVTPDMPVALQINKRVYSDLQPGERQSILSYLVAVTTLTIYW